MAFGPGPWLPLSHSFFKSKTLSHFTKEWYQRWNGLNSNRQTKIWFPKTDKNKSKYIVRLGRDLFGLACRWLTGHCFLRRHSKLLNDEEFLTSLCRFCEREDETPEHIIGHCDEFYRLRMDAFQSMNLDDPPVWKPDQLIKFLKNDRISSLEFQEDHNSALNYFTTILNVTF